MDRESGEISHQSYEESKLKVSVSELEDGNKRLSRNLESTTLISSTKIYFIEGNGRNSLTFT